MSFPLVCEFLTSFALIAFFIPPCFLARLSLVLSSLQKQRECTIRKLLSHTVQEGRRHIRDETILARCSLRLPFPLPPPPLFPLPHSLNLPPSPSPPFLIFLHPRSSVTLAFSTQIPPVQPSLNPRPAKVAAPASVKAERPNGFKRRKSSLALECWSEKGGAVTHAYRNCLLRLHEIRHLLNSSVMNYPCTNQGPLGKYITKIKLLCYFDVVSDPTSRAPWRWLGSWTYSSFTGRLTLLSDGEHTHYYSRMIQI